MTSLFPHPVRPASLSAIAALVLVAACGAKKDTMLSIATQPVERRDIVVDAEATGTVEPINVVEVKSKASGMIVKMPVETGTLVKPGDLLVQIETRDVQNQYDQAAAALAAARSRLEVATAAKRRADELFKSRIITTTEHETAQLDFANAQSALVAARTTLDINKQRLEDATVRAPVAGTIIEKDVALGTVITSATGAFGGGTTLLKMADLGQVRIRALFNETDIGQVNPGQPATVIVDAYPDRRFTGTVEKIEPQAVVQQNVTMFPVLVTLENREGLLKPGMNGETSVLVDQRTNVLAVPNDAVRNPREAAATAPMLGLSVDSVRSAVAAQMASLGGGRGAPRQSGEPVSSGAGQGGAADARQGTAVAGGGGQGFQLPEVTDKDCSAVTAALAKRPGDQAKLDSLRQQMMSGAIDRDAMRAETQKIYAAAGVDARVAAACRRRAFTGGGAGGASFAGGNGGGAQGTGGARRRPGLVFVKTGKSYEPRLVMLGESNFDFTEVLSGVKEGEQVALLAAAALQAQRQQNNERFRQVTGVPGMNQQGGGAAGGRAGAGGGGARQGGGR
ncbi:MAG TPA: efflux RND transporter periplasmic adaptor subunit [Gemmatimonadaceae bacterium]|nr:efflux RND transporter periplasmic adaptor subunit [Gemmatimonadaceae bacterium]